MEQISIVRRRSRLWPIVIAVIIIALVAAAALFFFGDAATTAVEGAIGAGAPIALAAWPPG
jgi:hypothetical protein